MKKLGTLAGILVFALMAGCSSNPKYETTLESWGEPRAAISEAQTARVAAFVLPAEFKGNISEKYRANYQTEWPKVGAEYFAKGINDERGKLRAYTTENRDINIAVTVTELHNGEGHGSGWYNPKAWLTARAVITDNSGHTLAIFTSGAEYGIGQFGDVDGYPHLCWLMGLKVKIWYERNRN